MQPAQPDRDDAATAHAPPPTGPVPPAAAPRDWLRGAPITRAIVALNVAVFVAQVALAVRAARPILLPDGTPKLLPDGTPQVPTLAELVAKVPHVESLQFGANYALATVHERRIETLVTACFLHAGIMHLGLNMLVLWQGGALVERAVGSARMAPMYLFAGVVSSALSTVAMYLAGGGSSVGASGAIMGVLAAALVLGWRVQGWRGPLTQSMVRWLGFNLVFGIVLNSVGGHIDNAAHIGGAIAGGLVAALWRRGVVYGPRSTRLVVGLCGAVVLAAGAAVVARDIVDPFAAMTAEERLTAAHHAVVTSRCKEAFAALRSVERLAANDPDVVGVRALYNMRCGRPM